METSSLYCFLSFTVSEKAIDFYKKIVHLKGAPQRQLLASLNLNQNEWIRDWYITTSQEEIDYQLCQSKIEHNYVFYLSCVFLHILLYRGHLFH